MAVSTLPHTTSRALMCVLRLLVQARFGVATVFPHTIMIEPPTTHSVAELAWLEDTCAAMKLIAHNVTTELRAQVRPFGWRSSESCGAAAR